MIKAGSLFYAIVISLIIAIVCSSLILFAYLSRIEFENFEMNQRIRLNADSGLNLLVSKQNSVELNQGKIVDLYNSGNDEVSLTRKSWGAYEILISKAVFKNNETIRVALAGCYPDTSESYSLYLADADKPLALCGKTKIKGTSYLPKAGVRRAYIEGQNFTGTTLVEGQIKQSEKILPEFNKSLIENITTLLTKKMITEKDSVIAMEKGISGDSLNNSFKNKPLILTSRAAVKISEGTYSGNIVIISDKKIIVSANAVLNNVILAAPKIIIEKDFKGYLQAFASDSIIVNKNVTLSYPSVLGLLSNDKSPAISSIVLNENDTLSGSVFLYTKTTDASKQSGVSMLEKSVVYGQVYSNGYVDIKGTIYGSLMCSKIIVHTPSAVYENHLLNAVIDITKLSKYYVGINLVEKSETKRLVQWLE